MLSWGEKQGNVEEGEGGGGGGDTIHLFPKWLPVRYSFVFIQMTP